MELSTDIPSMKNIYDSTYWNQVKQDEQKRSDNMYNRAKTPFDTGIVTMPATSDMFKKMNYTIPDNSNNQQYIQSLSGNKIDRESFTHSNMTPFLRKNVTQNTNLESMSPFLDNRSGGNQFWQTKKEVPCMFKPQANSGGNICGMKNNDDFYC